MIFRSYFDRHFLAVFLHVDLGENSVFEMKDNRLHVLVPNLDVMINCYRVGHHLLAMAALEGWLELALPGEVATQAKEYLEFSIAAPVRAIELLPRKFATPPTSDLRLDFVGHDIGRDVGSRLLIELAFILDILIDFLLDSYTENNVKM